VAVTLSSPSIFDSLHTETLTSSGIATNPIAVSTTTITIPFNSTLYPSTKLPLFTGGVQVFYDPDGPSEDRWESHTLIVNQSLGVSQISVKWSGTNWVMTFGAIDSNTYATSGNDPTLSYGFVLSLIMLN
jgi:hypothetical protein